MKTLIKLSLVFIFISNLVIGQHYSDWTGFEFIKYNKIDEDGVAISNTFAFNELCKDYTIDLSEYFLDAEKLPDCCEGEADFFNSWAKSLPPCVWDFISLEPGGILTIKKGYRWDGASNGLQDAIYNHRSSFVHDALYDLMRLEYLVPDNLTDTGFNNRKLADMLYYMIAIEDNQSKDAAEFDYTMIRNFGWIGTHLNSKLKNWKFHCSELTAYLANGRVRLEWKRPNASGDDPKFEEHFFPIIGYKIRRNGMDYAEKTFEEMLPDEWITTFEDTDIVNGTPYTYQVVPITANANLYDWSNLEHVVPDTGIGLSLELDGIDDFVEANNLCNDLCFNLAHAENLFSLTFEALVYPKEQVGRNAILAFNTISGGDNNMILYDRDDGKFYYCDENTDCIASNNMFPIENWYHLAVTIDETNTGILYVNGEEQLVFSTDIRPSHGGKFSIGQEWDGSNTSQHFKGMIDEVRIWNILRTKEDIQSTMHIPMYGNESGLIGLWHFDEPKDYYIPLNYEGIELFLVRMAFDATIYSNDGILIEQKLPSTLISEYNQNSPIALYQCYPNPFNLATTIKFNLKISGNVILKVYTATGREIETLANGYYPEGEHEVLWQAGNYPSGIYFYSLQSDEFFVMKKMILNK